MKRLHSPGGALLDSEKQTKEGSFLYNYTAFGCEGFSYSGYILWQGLIFQPRLRS